MGSRDPALRAALIDYERFRRDGGRSGRVPLVANHYAIVDRPVDYGFQRDHLRSDQKVASPSAIPPSAIMISPLCWPIASFEKQSFELREVQRVFLQWEEASLRRVREIQLLLGDKPLRSGEMSMNVSHITEHLKAQNWFDVASFDFRGMRADSRVLPALSVQTMVQANNRALQRQQLQRASLVLAALREELAD